MESPAAIDRSRSIAELWAERLQAVAGSDYAWGTVITEMFRSADVLGSGGGGYGNGIPLRKLVIEAICISEGYDINDPTVREAFDLDSEDTTEPWVFTDNSGFLLYAGPEPWDIIFLPSEEVEALKQAWDSAIGKQSVRGSSALLLATTLLATLFYGQQGQQAQPAPSLQETFEWITNTLKPGEGNNRVTHFPYRPYSRPGILMRIDPNHQEVIEKFSNEGCRVEIDVEVTDSDISSFGRRLVLHEIDTFDLKDIDPRSVRIQDSCEIKSLNCEDLKGQFVTFQTANAKAKIHEEQTSSIGKSWYGLTDPKESRTLDDLCKSMPGNPAYCDEPEHKDDPRDMTRLMLGFTTAEYAERFAKAFRHAVELCGGKPSAF